MATSVELVEEKVFFSREVAEIFLFILFDALVILLHFEVATFVLDK